MKLLSAVLVFSFLSSFAYADGNKCLDLLDHQAGAPWSVAEKSEILSAIQELNDLDEHDTAKVVRLLKQANTEAYIPYDSGDAGLYILIVEVKRCRAMWSGFIYNN